MDPLPRNGSGRTNRVAPDGSVHAVAERGMFWGNRGPLLGARGAMVRHHRGENWIVCVLEFHGRHRTQWRPGRLTELYFLDEATALAAGHRPCGECRHHDYRRFREAWGRAHPGDAVGARHLDRRLHADRLDGEGHRTYEADLAGLPDGAMVTVDGGPWLVRGETLRPWAHGGYGAAVPRAARAGRVAVLTPRATVAALRAGYEPAVHPSADHTVQDP